MDQQIINLFDEYTHKPLKREDFLKRLTKITGSTAAALAILPLLEVNYANAQTINQEDDRLTTERISYPGDGAEMKGYLAKPKKKGKYPAVIVIHENRGLNPHIEDISRRLALEGFQKLDAAKNLNNFIKAFDYLKTRKDCNKKFGCIGFCWGGGMANQLAVNVPNLRAAIPYYGRQADAADVPKIKAALLLQYAGQDERINAGIPGYEEALKKAGVRYQLFIYESVQHAFNNDTAPTRYNEEAAKLAWSRSVDFLKKELK